VWFFHFFLLWFFVYFVLVFGELVCRDEGRNFFGGLCFG